MHLNRKFVGLILIFFVSISLTDGKNVAEAQGGLGGSGGFFDSKPADHQQEKRRPAIAEKPCNSVPKSAITKGRFTVWTDPEDPEPAQRYRIVIEVKVSEKLEKYPRCDLSGSILGTDGYVQNFGGPTEHGFYAVKDQKVRLHVAVPGASPLVKDVIQVKSKRLDEEQRIELEF